MTRTRYCSTCQRQEAETLERGRPKVRRFRTGFVAVRLDCGHWTSVTSPQLSFPLEQPSVTFHEDHAS